MNKEQLSKRFETIAKALSEIRSMLEDCSKVLDEDQKSSYDARMCRAILTDLAWAVENCTVISKRQLGKNLEDTMGLSPGE